MHVLIDIVDATGHSIQKVFEGDVNANLTHMNQIQTGDMANGVYLVRIVSEKEMTFTKLVVVH